MPFYSTMAIVKTVDNVLANYATNTWWCEADDLTALQDFHDELVTFYQAIDGGMSNLVGTTNALELTSYLRTDPMPRPPVLTTNATLTPGGGAPLPTEVSLCLSFQGSRMAGVPQSRRRGRVYIPFFGESGNDTDGRPTSGIVGTLAAAGDALLTASGAAATWSWVVYSEVEPGYTVVLNGWVDNEWDTQRRRGRPFTSRTVFS
jgi:hypothetical protein